MTNIWQKTPLLSPTIGLIAGIVTAFFSSSLVLFILPICISLLLVIVKRFFRSNLHVTIYLHSARPIAIMLLFFSIGFLLDNLHRHDSVDFEYDDGLPPMVLAEVEEVKSMTYGERALVKIIAHVDTTKHITKPIRNLKAIITTDDYLLNPFDRLLFINGLKRIEENRNYQNDNYRQRCELQGIIWQQKLNVGEAEILPAENRIGLLLHNFRNNLIITLEHSHLDRATTGFLASILLGDSDLFNPDDRSIFSDAGISHILALSGLHTSIIASIILLLTLPLVLLGKRRLRYAVTIFFIWIFVLLTGCHLSAIRAAVMLTMVLGGFILERRNTSFNALCLSLMLILFFSPDAILDPGLHLSFVCVGCLLCAGQYSTYIFKKLPYLWAKLCSAALASIVAIFGSWALTAYYFNTFPLVFLPVNLLVLPLLPAYIILGFLHLIFCGFGLNFGLLIYLLDTGYALLLKLCQFFGSGTVLHLWVSAATPLLWIIALASIAYTIQRRNRCNELISATMIAIAIASIWIFPGNKPSDGLIVQSNYHSVSIAEYVDGMETVHKFNTSESQALLLGKMKICITGPEKAVQRHFVDSCDLLVITHAKRSLEELQNFFRPKMIALHPSLNSSVCEKLLNESKIMRIQVIHLRENGPLRLLEE